MKPVTKITVGTRSIGRGPLSFNVEMARRHGWIIIGSSTLCVCQHCGQEFHVAERCDPCAFCNDCKDDVLDKLAVGVVRFEPRAPRGKRTKAKRRARSR